MRIPFGPNLSVGTDIVVCKRILNAASPNPKRLGGLIRHFLRQDEFTELQRRFAGEQEAAGHDEAGHRRLPHSLTLEARWAANVAEQNASYLQRLSQHLSGRWAAKEAAKKAWGATLVSWKDLRVNFSETTGQTTVICSPYPDSDPDFVEQEATLSISHDGDYAAATVIASPLDSAILSELQRRKAEAAAKVRQLPSEENSLSCERPIANIKMAQKYSDIKYEQDPRAGAVDQYTSSHLLASSRNKFHNALEEAYRNSLAKGLPDISCYPSQGKFLAIQARIARAENILEVGTLGAYSTIWMATASEHLKITSVEVDPHHKEVAEENIANAGLSSQIEVVLGEGGSVLPKLKDDVLSGKRKPFDFVFIDADKANNLIYFNLAVDMARPGTGIYVDNVVRKGKLADPEAAKQDDRVAASRELVEAIGKNDKVEAVVLQTLSEKNYDGFLMAVVK
jgi:phosphopantetheine--protein transferase-like protein